MAKTVGKTQKSLPNGPQTTKTIPNKLSEKTIGGTITKNGQKHNF